jgi:hypothetical protein
MATLVSLWKLEDVEWEGDADAKICWNDRSLGEAGGRHER